ncbi:MAG: DUF3470 domain-containing protein [Balneolaceae bacterium]|nr:DUF3470 domain-containing protein [Balneolaceae bacterium]
MNQTEDPLPDADEWTKITDKRDKLQIEWD